MARRTPSVDSAPVGSASRSAAGTSAGASSVGAVRPSLAPRSLAAHPQKLPQEGQGRRRGGGSLVSLARPLQRTLPSPASPPLPDPSRWPRARARCRPRTPWPPCSTGTLTDGTKFDSSRDRGTPFKFQLGAGRVIKGWDEGIQGLCPGQKAILRIPPHMGYGDHGAGASIPGACLRVCVHAQRAPGSGSAAARGRAATLCDADAAARRPAQVARR